MVRLEACQAAEALVVGSLGVALEVNVFPAVGAGGVDVLVREVFYGAWLDFA